MEKSTFGSLIDEALAYFQRKPPTPETVLPWYGRVKGIPDAAVPAIKAALFQQERFPANFPEFILRTYFQDRAINRQRQVTVTHEEPCECHNGFWEVAQYRKELGEWAIYRFHCAGCNGHEKGVFNRDDLQAVNYRLLRGQIDREPQRFMVIPIGKILISNDPDSIKFMADQLRAHMAEVRKGRPEPIGITYDDLPF